MHASQSRFRRWLADWFGMGQDTESSDRAAASGNPEPSTDEQEPVFSLGETKQDVVVSYRAAQTDKS